MDFAMRDLLFVFIVALAVSAAAPIAKTGRPALTAATVSAPAAAEPGALQSDFEANLRQAEATIAQVQADMKRMATFSEEVQRNLSEEERAKQDVSHALGYFRRQIELSSSERDESKAHVLRLESEVSSLQARCGVLAM